MLYFASLKKSLHLFPLGRGQFQPCFKKYFAVCKNLLTYSHWEKPNAHPKSQKIFYPYTYLELRSRNAPCFYKNFEKIFSIEGLDSACSKSPFTYSHWEEANSNPVSKNILLFAKPLHLFGIRRLKRNLFFKKTEKIFWKNCLSQKYPLTYSHWERAFGDGNSEKRQKNLPARYGGQGILAFFSLNIGEKTFNST